MQEWHANYLAALKAARFAARNIKADLAADGRTETASAAWAFWLDSDEALCLVWLVRADRAKVRAHFVRAWNEPAAEVAADGI